MGGGEDDLQLEEREGLDILMRNCEDAYGFPPYPVLEGFLHGTHDRNLQAKERAIVAAALSGQPIIMLRSTTMDWSQRIAAYVSAPEQPRIEHSVGGADMAVRWRPA